jgi:uncharacterized protein
MSDAWAAESPMRFWDSSAIVPLLVEESASAAGRGAFAGDPDVIAWWATELECVSALARLERDGALGTADMTAAIDRLDALVASWHIVQPGELVRRTAIRLLRSHPLRSADAQQLAAAVAASEQEPSGLRFVTLDHRLAEVAAREGFGVTIPGPA